MLENIVTQIKQRTDAIRNEYKSLSNTELLNKLDNLSNGYNSISVKLGLKKETIQSLDLRYCIALNMLDNRCYNTYMIKK